MSDPQFSLIIPAAGAGSRLGGDVPKPYLEIAGKTILEHTLERFIHLESLRQIIIATSGEFLNAAEKLHERLPVNIDLLLVKGGDTRQQSIGNALQEVSRRSELVAIHDAVRPFVASGDIVRCLQAASKEGAAVLGIPVKDTIKEIGRVNRIVNTPDRRTLWQAQTPQIFRRELIRRAYDKAREENYLGTDDSSLVEFLGEDVVMIEGSGQNFKITYPFDLQLASWLMNPA